LQKSLRKRLVKCCTPVVREDRARCATCFCLSGQGREFLAYRSLGDVPTSGQIGDALELRASAGLCVVGRVLEPIRPAEEAVESGDALRVQVHVTAIVPVRRVEPGQ
jgi:hypothetical protein